MRSVVVAGGCGGVGGGWLGVRGVHACVCVCVCVCVCAVSYTHLTLPTRR